jgi:8-oxo-dGTP diphosphatase
LYTYKYPRPAVTVDIAIFVPIDDNFKVLLIQRAADPFKGFFALPGGFVEIQETLEEAARRELMEETGLKTTRLTQVHTFSAPDRDPRGRVISTCFAAVLTESSQLKLQAGSDAVDANWFNLDRLPPLAFDHSVIIQKVVENFLPKGSAHKNSTL